MNAGGNAILGGSSIGVAETGSVTANGTGNALLKATASDGTVVAKGAVKGANVTLDAPAGVTTSDNGTLESTAGDVYVHADAENVQIGSDVTATGNAVFKADAGAVELSDVAVVDAAGVGLQGNGLAEVRASNLGAGVRDLALVATAGGATLSGVPADVGNIGISVTGGDLVVPNPPARFPSPIRPTSSSPAAASRASRPRWPPRAPAHPSCCLRTPARSAVSPPSAT